MRLDQVAQGFELLWCGVCAGLYDPAVLATEGVQRTKQARLHHIKQAPDIGQAVLDGRAGAGHAKADVELLGRTGDQRVRVFNLLGFIAVNRSPTWAQPQRRRSNNTVSTIIPTGSKNAKLSSNVSLRSSNKRRAPHSSPSASATSAPGPRRIRL